MSLDQNLHDLLGEEWTDHPDVVEDESAGAGCHSDVGSKGQQVIRFHTQVHCSLSQGHHRVLSVNGEVMDGRVLPWKEE